MHSSAPFLFFPVRTGGHVFESIAGPGIVIVSRLTVNAEHTGEFVARGLVSTLPASFPFRLRQDDFRIEKTVIRLVQEP